LTVDGGVGVTENLNVGANLEIDGTTILIGSVTIADATPTTSQITGALKVEGGIGVGHNVQALNFVVGSSRLLKTNIIPTVLPALDIIRNTQVVDYNYKVDLATPKIGFIAEDTHSIMSTVAKDSMDITNCIGLLIKSVQELNDKIESIRM